MLWGQDLNGTGPGAGARPASDYLEGKGATGGHNERRRAYLKAVTQLLVDDLETMVGNWKPGVADNYRATLEAEPVTDGLRKMLFGMGSLSLGELAGERMKVSLEANSLKTSRTASAITPTSRTSTMPKVSVTSTWASTPEPTVPS